MKTITCILATGLMFLTACIPINPASVTPLAGTASPQPTATRVFPTPSSPTDSITWGQLQVTMDQLEITQDYLTDYGSSRIPTEDNKFLWVHLRLKNTGQVEMDLPGSEHFSILYAAIELKPTYGHRAEYVDYTALGPTIFPGQELDGWLRFDIPSSAQLNDLRFIFLPVSSQVGTLYSSPNYPYSNDKPTYVWRCTIK